MVDVRTNLLKGRQTLSEKDYQRERTFLMWSVSAMIIVVIMAAALSAWNFMLSRQLSGIEQMITASSKEMQGLTQASAIQIYLKSRLKLVTGFLTDRTQTREALQKILSINVADTHISSLDFQSDTMLGVQYVADSVNSLSQLIAYYQADTNYFTQVVSRSLMRSRDGNYQVSFLLTLPGGAK